MPRSKNFLEQQPNSSVAADADFEMLFARHTAPHRVAAHTIPIDRIRPNPFQPRRKFEDIEELAQAIRVQGFTTRLRVRRDPAQPGYFQLLYGERRLRAAQAAGLTEVPCDVAEQTDDDLIEIGLAENIQRRDLDPIEEAQAFQTLITQRRYTQQRLAERIGKDRSYIEARLALLRVPEDVQQMLMQRPDAIRAAREIAKIPTPTARRPLIDGILAGALTRDDVTALVREEMTTPTMETAAMPTSTGTIMNAAPPTTSGGDQPRGGSNREHLRGAFDRALARDIPAMRATFSRWRQAAPTLTPTQREQILAFIDVHIAEIEQLTEALKH
jgi:ParB family chromosome partitioning protein